MRRSILCAALAAILCAAAQLPARADVELPARISGTLTAGDCIDLGTLDGIENDAGAACMALVDKGTTFTLGTGTGACATKTTLTGGSAVGSFKCTGTTGASTQVINLPTAVNGWVCDAHDITTTANALTLNSSTTASATIGGTVNANDVIAFKCRGY